MASFKSSAALIVLAVTATACGPETNRLTPVSNPSLYSVNQPVVQRTDYVLDLNSTGSGIPASERDRLIRWFETLQLGYGDRIWIDQSGGYADPQARQDVAEVAGQFGLLISEGAPVTVGMVQPGSVRVIVSRTSASVPGCPIWQDEPIGAPERTSTNFGCATNSNLAAMIADPNDLVLGQTGSGSGDALTASKAIRLHRETAPTGSQGLTETSTTGGK